MTNDRNSKANAILEQIEKIQQHCNSQAGQDEAISSSDLRSRYARLSDSLKRPIELAHLIAILGALIDQMTQVPGDFLKTKDIRG